MAGLLIKLGYWLAPSTTNVDRRKCSRQVPMEILILGLSRTGTTSMRAGLRQLGYHDVYHMTSCTVENPRDAEMWVPAYKAKYQGQGKPYGRAEFDKLLGHCMAVSDVPCIHFGTDLIDAYPNAKVILTIRDSPEAWLKSVKSTLIPVTLQNAGYDTWSRVKKLFAPRLPFDGLLAEMLVMTGQAESEALRSFEKTTVEEYTKHCDRIRAAVAARNDRLVADGRAAEASPLLEFNVKQGWRPLCEFLGKSVPRGDDGEELPFPRLNDTKEFLDNTSIAARALTLLTFLNMIFAALGVWGIVHLVLKYGPVGKAHLGL